MISKWTAVLKGRAYWSLSNAYTALGQHHKAMQYARLHLNVSKEIGDEAGKMAADENLRDLQIALSTQSNVTGR